jgi:probable phosphoglycerate mutase
MKLFLIRHGQTTGDLEDRYGGTYDDHLTELGQKQLQQTAEQLIGKGIETIYHSPLIRARESAEIIADKIGCPLVEVTGIKERDYGILGGLTKAEALDKYPDAVEAHKDYLNTDPEGESWEDFNTRVGDAFVEILNQANVAKHETIIILAHGGSLKRILDHLGEPLPDSIADGGIIEILVD